MIIPAHAGKTLHLKQCGMGASAIIDETKRNIDEGNLRKSPGANKLFGKSR